MVFHINLWPALWQIQSRENLKNKWNLWRQHMILCECIGRPPPPQLYSQILFAVRFFFLFLLFCIPSFVNRMLKKYCDPTSACWNPRQSASLFLTSMNSHAVYVHGNGEMPQQDYQKKVPTEVSKAEKWKRRRCWRQRGNTSTGVRWACLIKTTHLTQSREGVKYV